jgi:hypothetical protein
MPFKSDAGHEFSETGIAGYAPAASGVYGIYNGTQRIYIDEAQDIKAYLYANLRGESNQSAHIMPQRPAYFILEKCDPQSRLARKLELIKEHRPRCSLA